MFVHPRPVAPRELYHVYESRYCGEPGSKARKRHPRFPFGPFPVAFQDGAPGDALHLKVFFYCHTCFISWSHALQYNEYLDSHDNYCTTSHSTPLHMAGQSI
jgi:hypothetical protein